MRAGVQVMVYDRTCWGQDGRLPLSFAWWAGAVLYRVLGRLQVTIAASSWSEALDGLLAIEHPIEGIQFWGHGRWGQVLIGRESMDVTALQDGHPLNPQLVALQRRLSGVRWWFRTCETLGAQSGHAFAQKWSAFFDAPVAGHTFVIGFWQSGLHCLRPGDRPHWSDSEGVVEGSPHHPRRAAPAAPWHPNTITCFHGSIPADW